MPKGPTEERHTADVTGNAIKIGRNTTGEKARDDTDESVSSAAAAMGRKGGKARASKLTPERREEIARKAAEKRWKKD